MLGGQHTQEDVVCLALFESAWCVSIRCGACVCLHISEQLGKYVCCLLEKIAF